MKRSIFMLLLVGCLMVSFVVPAAASENTVNTDELAVSSVNVEYLDDGSYLVTTIRESATPRGEVYSKRASKSVVLYNDDDEVQWIYTLVGTYTVETGVSAVCTDAYRSYEIFDFDWKETEHSEWYSGNVAYGESVFKKKVLFITTSTQEIHASMACDVYGGIS